MNTNMAPTLQDRIEGGLYGMLVGDALGVPYEFHKADAIPPLAGIEMTPPAGYRRAHAGVPPGTWSDDGAQALCLTASLLHCGRVDVEDLGRRFCRWLDEGYLAVDHRVFDVGVQTRAALAAIRSGTPAARAARTDEGGNGNGSLMRVLPLALWHKGSDAELVEDAHLTSLPTHGHARAQVCCALYVLWARRLLHGVEGAFDDAHRTLRGLYAQRPVFLAELDTEVLPSTSQRKPQGSGYVVDCLRSARLVMQEHATYEAVVKHAVALGNDTDTTACVAGGVAGVRGGVGAIPARWREMLRGREEVAPLLEGLLKRHA